MEISKENVRNIYPLSPAQEGFLFHHLAEEDPLAYIQQICYHVRGPLDPRLFEAAWNAMIARHDILRTAMVYTGAKRPLQVVLKDRPLDFTFEDISGLDRAAQRDFIEAFRDRDRRFPFEPATARLNRVAVVRLAADDHEVVWSHHHMVMDGWSIGILQSELVDTYRALNEGRAPGSGAAPPYSRYIRYLESLDPAVAAEYWRRYLSGYSRPADFPPSATARAASPRDVRTLSNMFSSEFTSRLENFARSCEVTLSTVLQTVWGILLARYNPSEDGIDVVFGSVVSGRPPEIPGIDRMVGLFVNTIPLRVRAGFNESLRDVLARIQKDSVEREPHQYYQLAKIQSASDLKQNLIPTLAAMENYPVDKQIQATQTSLKLGYSVDRVVVFERTHYDFLVQFLPGENLTCRFQFNTALHLESAVAALGRRFEMLLEMAVSDPQITVARMQEAVAGKGEARAEIGFELFPVHRRVETQATARPRAVAVSCGGDSLTYEELNTGANRLARLLQSLGVGPEVHVGICCDRSCGLIVGMLAVLKAGGVYVPIDPAYPAERIAYLVEDSGIQVCIADDAGASVLPGGLITISTDAAAEFFGENLNCEPCASQAAYIIYTSGSTGRPKGCVLTQENLSRLFTATEAWFGFGPDDVWTVFHSAAFDFSVWEMWGALVYGGRLAIVPYWLSRSPAEFAELMEIECVTVLSQTPSAFRQLLAGGLLARAESLALRVVVFGGEALSLSTLAPWFASPLAERAELVNMYGITETTVHVTYRVICREDVKAARGSMIGVPIPDLSLRLRDSQGLAAPDGVAAEICVGGAGVARGYWKRPGLTASRFVPNPEGRPGARLYRSGDLARRTQDGDLEYIGRADGQLKIRGFRIEPGEIESAISDYPGVREVAVVANTTQEGDPYLVAYVAGADPEGLREFLKDRLPAYMIPAILVPLDRLPLTAHGKVDRAALPAPVRASAKTWAAPSGPVEEAIAEVWGQVLGAERIGVHDNYLDLGGDSITAIRIVAALLQRQLSVGVRDLFRYPTIAELAPCVRVTADKSSRAGVAPAEARFSPAQAQFFAKHTIDPHWFNHAVFVALPAGMKTERADSAWQAIWQRHDALRLRFFRRGETWRQGLSAVACPAVSYVDLRGASDAEGALAEAANRAQTGFDVEAGPLLRLVHFALPSEDRLLVVIHHLVVDAVSWRILLEDFETALAGESLPPAPGSFLQWCEEVAADGANDSDFGGASHDPFDTYGNVASLSRGLNASETEDLLREAGVAYNTSTEELLLAALACALRQWSGEPENPILLESHGREGFDRLDLSRTVGWFTRIYPVLLVCEEPFDFAYMVKRTKETLRRVPRPSPDARRASIRFNYLGNPRGNPAARDAFAVSTDGVGITVSPAALRPVPLELSAVVVEGQLEISAAYGRLRFEENHVSRLLTLWGDCLRDVIRHCCGREAEVTPSDLTFGDFSLEEFDRMLQ